MHQIDIIQYHFNSMSVAVQKEVRLKELVTDFFNPNHIGGQTPLL